MAPHLPIPFLVQVSALAMLATLVPMEPQVSSRMAIAPALPLIRELSFLLASPQMLLAPTTTVVQEPLMALGVMLHSQLLPGLILSTPAYLNLISNLIVGLVVICSSNL